MDTNRIIINNYDLSTSLAGASTNVTGFTVVKAPKGPITPIRIPQGNSARITDIFGGVSKEYPELFEATYFNREFDVYISAPYSEAKVPVAYVTHKGIYAGSELAKYNTTTEEYVTGRALDGTGVASLLIPDNPMALIDVKKPGTCLGIREANSDYRKEEATSDSNQPTKPIADVTKENEYTASNIVINTGVTQAQIGWDKAHAALATTEYLDAEIAGLRLGNLPLKDEDGNPLDYIDLKIKINSSSDDPQQNTGILTYDEGGKIKVGTVEFSGEAGAGTMVIKISGFDKSGSELSCPLTTSVVQGILSDVKYYKNVTAEWLYPVKDHIYSVIFPKYSTTNTLHLNFKSFDKGIDYVNNTPAGRNLIKMYVSEENTFHAPETGGILIEASMDPNSKTPNGTVNSFDVSDDMATQDIIAEYTVRPITQEDFNIFFNINMTQYPEVILKGGTRKYKGPKEIHQIGWAEAEKAEYSNVDIFFDSERHDSSSGNTISGDNIFYSLANIHKLSGYIFNKTVTSTTLATENSLKEINPLTYGPNYWNVCNEAIVALDGTSSRIVTPLTGARARMQARIIKHREGGVAPMFLNSGVPQCGGQLEIPILRLSYTYSKDQQTALDKLNYNPVVNDSAYGVMVVGHKTCKAGAITDWSFIGHVSSFLKFEKEVRETVMLPQIGKPNNDFYRALRKQQVEHLLESRIAGNNRIWADASVDTSTAPGINDTQALKAHRFIINVKVKVDIFSEEVVLNFINVAQGTNV